MTVAACAFIADMPDRIKATGVWHPCSEHSGSTENP